MADLIDDMMATGRVRRRFGIFPARTLGPDGRTIDWAHCWNRWHDPAVGTARGIDGALALRDFAIADGYWSEAARWEGEALSFIVKHRYTNYAMWQMSTSMFEAVTARWPERWRDRRVGPGWNYPDKDGVVYLSGWDASPRQRHDDMERVLTARMRRVMGP